MSACLSECMYASHDREKHFALLKTPSRVEAPNFKFNFTVRFPVAPRSYSKAGGLDASCPQKMKAPLLNQILQSSARQRG